MQHHGCTSVAGVWEPGHLAFRGWCTSRWDVLPLLFAAFLACLPSTNNKLINTVTACVRHRTQRAVTDEYTTASLQGILKQMAEDVLAGMRCCVLCHDPTTLSP